MIKKWLIIFVLFAFLPLPVLAAADLSIDAKDVKFSNTKPLANNWNRIYTTVKNIDQPDVRGVVRFYINNKQLGSDQPISVVAGGSATVFMDWTPSEGFYNISIEVVNIDPADGNLSNNRAEIKDFLVDSDTDSDGISNTEDLDDDNDAVSDGVEVINGTNPVKWDTDGDGAGDKEDAFPLDSGRTQAPAEAERVLEAKPETTATSPVIGAPAADNKEFTREELNYEFPALTEANRKIEITLAASRQNWRTWKFEALGAAGITHYLWDWGDGKLSESQEAMHSFPGSGTYKVVLSVSDDNGGVGQAEKTIIIGFWHLANFWFQLLLGFLILSSVGLGVVVGFNLLPQPIQEKK
ncbi:MAG: PKD domain-containing protein [Candidatus Komeilibacteria bacterium]|nr:PKD domain-containing protein [Candidatus Komeilibacteria bacterium]